MVKWSKSIAIGAAAFVLSLPISITLDMSRAEAEPATDKLSQMFIWWNQAMKTPGAYTAEAFSKYFTDDAALLIDGSEVMRTPAGWASRFQKIQAATDAVEVVVPFRHSFQVGNKIYTYHVIRSRAQGKVSCMLAAGHADLRNGLISNVSLVRAEIDPAADVDCWKQ